MAARAPNAEVYGREGKVGCCDVAMGSGSRLCRDGVGRLLSARRTGMSYDMRGSREWVVIVLQGNGIAR